MLLDYTTIIGRAAWVLSKAGLLGTEPPYSTRRILEKVFPKIPVSGAPLPRGVTEMAIVEKNGRDVRRALFYSKNVGHQHQRVGLMHGLFHHLSDMKTGVGIRECSIPFRQLARTNNNLRDPVELSCDLFAAETLTPMSKLDEYAPSVLFSQDAAVRSALDDEIDNLCVSV